MERVLLTGAAGGIGSGLRKLLKPLYKELRLSDLDKPADLRSDEPFIAADLSRIEEVEKAVDGMEGVIHLGGHSVEGSWDTILQANIIGCYNLFEAARRRGVKRVVFASSNHAIGFYPRYAPDRHRRHRAARLALRRQQGLRRGAGRALCRQARAARPVPQDRQRTATAPSTSGGCRSGSRPRIGPARAHRPGAPRTALRDLLRRVPQRAQLVGQQPRLRLRLPPDRPRRGPCRRGLAAQAKIAPDPVGDFFQGGPFCSAEFDGDRSRIRK